MFAIALATVVELAGGTGWDLGGHGAGDWLAAAASGVLYYGLGFWFFVTGLRQVPASVAGSFLPLIPVFGLAAGVPGRGAAGAAAVGRRGRHRRCHRRDRDPSARRCGRTGRAPLNRRASDGVLCVRQV